MPAPVNVRDALTTTTAILRERKFELVQDRGLYFVV